MTDEELLKLAEQSILREARLGAARAEICGPSGYLKCKLPSTNKTFLHNTLKGVISANTVQEKKQKIRQAKIKQSFEDSKKYKRLYIKASTKKSEVPVPHRNHRVMKVDDDKVEKNKKNNKLCVWHEDGLEFQCLRKNKNSDSKVFISKMNFVSKKLKN